MMVVKVEVWPFGDAERAYPVGVIAIANKGRVEGDLAKYDVELHNADTGKKVSRHLTHYRRRGWLRLVKLALESLDG